MSGKSQILMNTDFIAVMHLMFWINIHITLYSKSITRILVIYIRHIKIRWLLSHILHIESLQLLWWL